MPEEGYLQEKWEIRLMLQENARRVTKEDDRKVSEELLDELMKNSRMLQCSSNYDILSQPSTLTIYLSANIKDTDRIPIPEEKQYLVSV